MTWRWGATSRAVGRRKLEVVRVRACRLHWLSRTTSQRRPFDTDDVALVGHAGLECTRDRPLREYGRPLVVTEVGCDDRRLPAVTRVNELEQQVCLLLVHRDVGEFVQDQNVNGCEASDEPRCAPVQHRCIELVYQLADFAEERGVAAQDRGTRQAHRQPALAHPHVANKADVRSFPHEVELRELLDLGAVHAGLLVVREGLQGPVFGKVGALQAVPCGPLLTPLRLRLQEFQ